MDRKESGPRRTIPKVDSNVPNKFKDTRPIKEKDFQIACAKIIIEFLVENVYHSPLTLTTFQTPDMKIFWQIAEFSFKLLDPRCKCTNEQEVTALAKWLGYPFPLTSQMLHGAHHLWGHLVAFLSWLAEVIGKSTCKPTSKDAFLVNEYLCEAYHRFLIDREYDSIRHELFENLDTLAMEYTEKNIQLDTLIEEATKKTFEVENNQDTEEIDTFIGEQMLAKKTILFEMSRAETQIALLESRKIEALKAVEASMIQIHEHSLDQRATPREPVEVEEESVEVGEEPGEVGEESVEVGEELLKLYDEAITELNNLAAAEDTEHRQTVEEMDRLLSQDCDTFSRHISIVHSLLDEC